MMLKQFNNSSTTCDIFKFTFFINSKEGDTIIDIKTKRFVGWVEIDKYRYKLIKKDLTRE